MDICQHFPFLSLFIIKILKKGLTIWAGARAPPHFHCSDLTVRLKSGRTLRHSKIHEEEVEGGSRRTLGNLVGISVDPGDVVVEAALETLIVHLQVPGLNPR